MCGSPTAHHYHYSDSYPHNPLCAPQSYSVTAFAPVPKWILALGGAGLVAGLATYGYNIIRVGGCMGALMAL